MPILKPFMIGDLEVKIPIVQGGMGVKISTASLASAVAKYGGAGTIASVGLGVGTPEQETDFLMASRRGLQEEVQKAKKMTKGIVGVNILVALSNYEELVRIAAQEKVDFIVSGAGLPLKLPEFIEGAFSKLIPIVSSARAADLLIKIWKKRYNYIPDAIVVEGPLAGGHLGFSFEEIVEQKKDVLERLVNEILVIIRDYEKRWGVHIPLIAAGGIFDGKDIARFLMQGVSAVQMGTRFVVTHECSVPNEIKEMYIDAEEKDVVIIKSPVGLPGRVLKNLFVERLMKKVPQHVICRYQCLKTCDPHTAPYCIAKALTNATCADSVQHAVVFAGHNVWRVKEKTSVQELMDSLVHETLEALASR